MITDRIAIARGHLSGDWLGLASIWTDDHRRRGWATTMIIGLGHWAARQGARYGYLQVASANQHAIAAYEQLGFARHHSYRYLRPPGGRLTRDVEKAASPPADQTHRVQVTRRSGRSASGSSPA